MDINPILLCIDGVKVKIVLQLQKSLVSIHTVYSVTVVAHWKSIQASERNN